MKRLSLVLLSILCGVGCVNSQAFQQMMTPTVGLQDPTAWDVVKRVHPQGEAHLNGTPVVCDGYINRSEAVLTATVKGQAYPVPPGGIAYRCDNMQIVIMVQQVMTPGQTHGR